MKAQGAGKASFASLVVALGCEATPFRFLLFNPSPKGTALIPGVLFVRFQSVTPTKLMLSRRIVAMYAKSSLRTSSSSRSHGFRFFVENTRWTSICAVVYTTSGFVSGSEYLPFSRHRIGHDQSQVTRPSLLHCPQQWRSCSCVT